VSVVWILNIGFMNGEIMKYFLLTLTLSLAPLLAHAAEPNTCGRKVVHFSSVSIPLGGADYAYLQNEGSNAQVFCVVNGYTASSNIIAKNVSCAGDEEDNCYVENDNQSVIKTILRGFRPVMAKVDKEGIRTLAVISSLDCQ
jgi:hypothetical protein